MDALFRSSLLLIGLLFGTLAWCSTQSRLIAGWVEWVILEPWELTLKGKLDTGAKTSSLHAVDIEYFKRDGQDWVRFKTFNPRHKSKTLTVERPLLRDVKIKRHTAAHQERPVVTLDVCLGNRMINAEFSLIDRGRFNYPVLLGRRLLQQEKILVDASTTYTLDLDPRRCKALAKSLQPSNPN
ncbi:MAG: ATP-dependent zinc protease [Methylohalobius sp.]|nr:ATP-dependent zinc protease [Methylohalobius sp.]